MMPPGLSIATCRRAAPRSVVRGVVCSMVRAMALLLVVGATLAACSPEPAKPKRMQTVKLLPDTPPPPPPPPRPEEKRPEPKKDEAPPPLPQPQQPEQPQALKTDEAAGTGPGSGLVSGEVKQDYTNQQIGSATQPAAAGLGVNRLAANAFASNVTRALNDYLARERGLKERDYRVPVNLWLQSDGRVQRVELAGSTGNGAVDDALRAALERFPGAGLPLPDRLPQPLRVQVSNRLIG